MFTLRANAKLREREPFGPETVTILFSTAILILGGI
jgi:hypothetical protein